MKRGWKVVGGAGLGAAAMYFLDPDSGGRRRALLRDRVLHGARSAAKSLDVFSRRAANRSRALLTRARSRTSAEPVPDGVLAERVRSQIGHVLSHAGTVEVSAHAGRVTLSGSAPHEEVRRLLKRVSRVPGVVGVENDIEARDQAAP